MSELKESIASLIDDGEKMSFGMFPKDEYGFPKATPSDWIRWYTRSVKLIGENFKSDSSPAVLIKRGASLARSVEGNHDTHFNEAKENILAALRDAATAAEHDPFGEIIGNSATPPSPFDTKKVFVVHGHDETATGELEVFLQEVGLDPVVLHRKPDEGRTIIEKFEEHSQVGFAVVLLTPDDQVMAAGRQESRARQNVVFELGFFYGRLGRNRVCCLYKEGTTLPSDISGIVYKPYRLHIDEVKYALVKELKAAGLAISL